jgi:ketosteroid isomerase-like protein
MATVDDLDLAIENWRLATAEFIRGNPLPAQESFSHRADVTLANPLGPASPEIGPVAHGWEQVALTQEHAASRFTDGADVDFEIVQKYVSARLACVVLIERMKANVLGRGDASPSAARVALRVTMTFRPEDGTWKVVHRHADPITTPQPAESVIRE